MEAYDESATPRRGWVPQYANGRLEEKESAIATATSGPALDVAKAAPGLVSITFTRIGALVSALLTFHGDFTISTKGASGVEWFNEAVRWRVSVQEWFWLLGREELPGDVGAAEVIGVLDQLISLVHSLQESAGVLALQ